MAALDAQPCFFFCNFRHISSTGRIDNPAWADLRADPTPGAEIPVNMYRCHHSSPPAILKKQQIELVHFLQRNI
jgi:hypothetical protein